MYRIPEDIWQVISKVIIPALVAVSVGIAVKMKQKRISILSAVTSYVIGVGFAFIFGFVIIEGVQEQWVPILIGTIAITGEKVGYWLIFKFKFDTLGDALIEVLKRWLLGK